MWEYIDTCVVRQCLTGFVIFQLRPSPFLMEAFMFIGVLRNTQWWTWNKEFKRLARSFQGCCLKRRAAAQANSLILCFLTFRTSIAVRVCIVKQLILVNGISDIRLREQHWSARNQMRLFTAWQNILLDSRVFGEMISTCCSTFNPVSGFAFENVVCLVRR